jgi:hypothetical protein
MNNLEFGFKLVVLFTCTIALNIAWLFIVPWGIEVLGLAPWILMMANYAVSVVAMIIVVKLVDRAWWKWYINR